MAERLRIRDSLPPLAVNTINAAKILGVSEAKMRKMRSEGNGPEFKHIGKKVVYRVADLRDFLERL